MLFSHMPEGVDREIQYCTLSSFVGIVAVIAVRPRGMIYLGESCDYLPIVSPFVICVLSTVPNLSREAPRKEPARFGRTVSDA